MTGSIYSSWAEGLRKSDITEVLNVSRLPGMMSLAAGVPFPDSYPATKIAEILEPLVLDNKQTVLPYPLLQGTLNCREAVAYRMSKRVVKNVNPDNIVISSGSTAAMDAITRILMNPGDTMIIEAPTFMGCLDSIKNWGLNLVEVPIDNDGIRTDILKDKLAGLKNDGIRPKMIYLMSNYHNPGGIMISQERRRELVDIAYQYNCFIVEDDAYSELIYDNSDQTPIKACDDKGMVFYLGSFSKLVAPGLRIGWAVVPDEIVKTWNISRPMIDVGAPALNQEIIAALHKDNWLDGHITNLIEGYRKRRNAMKKALEDYMPKECSWTDPHGGFYFWVTTPETMDVERLFQTSVKNKITFFPGKFFYLDHQHHNHFRLCFSLLDEESIREGVRRIAESVKEELSRS